MLYKIETKVGDVMSDKTQMLKGILDGCILSIMSKNEVYGYELSEKLKNSGFFEISEGSIYPLLSRMQKEGFIEGTFKDSPDGPKRKYYHVTEKGLQTLESFKKSWNELQTNVNNILTKGGD